MATLVLTAVGTIVGGPIGGAIGALIGQRADQALFAPKAREGPRLGDLAVQTSSYGSAIPRIFGTMRVAGTVIWATDIREERSSDGGGKGQPRSVNYSYSASFAVALSGRPIRAIRRIWADGKLLRGTAGDFKSRTGFRFHPGSEDQPVDPLIASIEGAGQAPAFRGIAYALFEDLALEDFGNRIPSLSFEVEADAGQIAIGSIAAELSGGTLSSGETPALHGYAASGGSVRGALDALSDVVPLSIEESALGLTIRTGAPSPVTVDEAQRIGPLQLSRGGSGKLPSDVTVTYYEAARDYQLGLQRAFRAGAGRTSDRRELPAVVDAEAAKSFAEERLARLWAGAARAKIELRWTSAQLRAGTRVALSGRSGMWRVERWTLGAMRVTLELVAMAASSSATCGEAAPGRSLPQQDLVHGPTELRLFDLPLDTDGRNRPMVLAMAAGGEGWRRAELIASFDGGGSWHSAGATAAPAVMGTAVTIAGPGDAALFDDRGAFEVELLNDEMWLESRGDDALAAGANLAVLGKELIQFGRAEPLGGRRFRLSRLLRGRRGTEWAAASHVAGEAFALVDAAMTVTLEVPATAIGSDLKLMASGIGDTVPAEAEMRISGTALQPPAPVHMKAQSDGEGGLSVSWVRRSRLGWMWAGGGDAPLAEESEQYRLTISGSGFRREIMLAAPAYAYGAAERSADGAGGPIEIEVVQIGTFALSRPARLQVQ